MLKKLLLIICICIIGLAVMFGGGFNSGDQDHPQLGSKENPRILPCNMKIHAMDRYSYLLRPMREGEFPEMYFKTEERDNKDMTHFFQGSYVQERRCDTD